MKRDTDRPRLISLAVLFLLTACIMTASLFVTGIASSSMGTAKGTQKMSLYIRATEEQFVNNSDDRQRGQGNNPFGNFKDLTATTKEHGNGPFPGDEALFKFNVYSDVALKKVAGSAIFTCQYNFNKNATCDASYLLSGGSLFGIGEFNFDATTFAVAITGGTGKYRSVTGDVEATPSAKHAQHLAFVLT